MAGFDPSEYFADDRLQKLRHLRSRGVEPYPPWEDRSCPIGEYTAAFADEDGDELAAVDEEYALAGRVDRFNELGSITFLEIADGTGSVQLFLRADGTAGYDLLGDLDRSDYVRAVGRPMRTDRGELSLDVRELSVLVKALRHPPSYDGLNEKSRVRERAIAIRTADLRGRLDDRFAVLSATRRFLEDRGYVEVDTPTLQNVYGGASATPFETYSTALDEDLYLRIAMELHLKRLLVGGYADVFEIGKTFRNEDVDTTHHPEFTMLELYRAYADYADMMRLTEDLVSHLLSVVGDGDPSVTYDGETLDFSTPWRRLPMRESLREFADVDVTALDDDELRRLALDHDAAFDDGYSRDLAVLELYEALVEDDITQPTFVTEFPKETSPLCRSVPGNPDLAERFELVVAGVEVANAFTELNDPIEQGERFASQLERYERGDEEAHRMDEDFLETLAYGMPPTGGVGIGMDRLVMVLTGATSIKEVLPFPMVATEE